LNKLFYFINLTKDSTIIYFNVHYLFKHKSL